MNTLRQDKRGFVSIFSVLIIMAILTLITIGFSSITRHAQQRVLDSQLNTQAFYAAESGINEARAKITAAIAANVSYDKNTCQAAGDGYTYNNNLDSGLNVGYTCVLISSKNPTLVFTNVPLEGSANAKTTTFKLSTGAAPQTFDVIWSAHTNPASFVPSNVTTLLPLAAWTTNNYIGLVRMDLIPIDIAADAHAYDRANLATKGFSFFLYGTQAVAAGTETVVSGSTGQGELVYARCTTSTCTAHIRLSPAVATQYMMRLQSVYQQVDVTIANGVDVNGTVGTWQDGEALIDVTGKANDIFRRIQVRIPLTKSSITSSFSLQSADSICKRLAALPGNTTTDSLDNSCLAN